MTQRSKQEILAPHEVFYIQSMLFNTLSAAKSISQVNAVLHVVQENSPEDPMGALPVHLILDELQNFLIQAAAVSRYVWPSRADHEWRGTKLRQAFGLDDDSPLRSRELRNCIEHFDERLDLFIGRDLTGHVLPEYVGPLIEHSGVPVRILRAYYVDKGIYELLGKRFDVQPLAEAILAVHRQLTEMDKTGGRLVRSQGPNRRS